MKKYLTLKQTEFILAYLDNGGNKVQAALTVYNTSNYKSASKIADSNFHNPLIRKQINQALTANDISASTIAEKIQEGLEAKLEIFDKNSNSYTETRFPNHTLRYKYLMMAAQLLGLITGGKY